MNFPTSVDSFTVVNGTTLLSSGHADLHNQVGSAVIAVENKIGLGAGTPIADKILVGSGNGTSIWGSVVNNLTLGTPSITGGTITTPLVSGGTVNNLFIGTPQITGGTLASASIGTPTILGGTIAVNGTVTPLSIGAGLVPTAGTVADAAGGTITINAQAANEIYCVMGTAAGNRTIAAPLNPTSWQSLTYNFQTSGSANGTLIWNSIFQISQDSGTPTLGTGILWNSYAWRYNPIAVKWQFRGQVKNIG